MKKSALLISLSGLLATGLAATAVAAGASPFGQFGSYDKVEVFVDGTSVKDRGVLIEGKLYVPVDPLRDMNKAAYYYDPQTYQVYLFFGGRRSNPQTVDPMAVGGTPLATGNVQPGFMEGIPYDADNYHAGMMRQDIINIATLAKALLDTSRDLDNVVYSKLTFNRNPDMNLLRQRLMYRSMPFSLMKDRMDALADELGRQIGSSYKRKMKDVMDELDTAVRKKEKAMDALEDWIRSSDKDDLDDFRDYEDDAKDSIYSAIRKLTGENIKNPQQKYSDNIKERVEKWAQNQRK